MGYYLIKNITNKLPKRHSKKDATLIINYNIGFKPNKYNLKPDEEIYISCKTIPSSIQLLRIKKLVWIKEISENAFLKTKIKNSSIVPEILITKKENAIEKKETKYTERKKSIRKTSKIKNNE